MLANTTLFRCILSLSFAFGTNTATASTGTPYLLCLQRRKLALKTVILISTVEDNTWTLPELLDEDFWPLESVLEDLLEPCRCLRLGLSTSLGSCELACFVANEVA